MWKIIEIKKSANSLSILGAANWELPGKLLT